MYKKEVSHQYTRTGPDVLWMAPFAEMLTFVVIILIVWTCTRILASRYRDYVNLAVLLVAACGAVLLMSRSLAAWASCLLAVGVGTQLARYGIRYSRLIHKVACVSLPMLVVATAGIGWTARSLEASQERLAADRYAVRAAEQMNVLLIVWDTVRARSVSAYGYPERTTPFLAKYAESSVRYANAFSTAPWTLPSHASLFTGRYPHELSRDWFVPLDDAHPTLAEVMSQHGYATAGMAANTIFCSREQGLARGFGHFEDFVVTPGQFVLSSTLARSLSNLTILRDVTNYHYVLGRRDAREINTAFFNWIDMRAARQPFFVFLNYMDAHEPRFPPREDLVACDATGQRQLSGMWHSDNEAEYRDKQDMSRDQAALERRVYDASPRYLDESCGELIEGLRMRGLADNTIVVITADHGEECGEHGVFSHGSTLYSLALHVPLVIHIPGGQYQGHVVQQDVSLVDVAATVASLTIGADPRIPGTPLPMTSVGPQAQPRPAIAEVLGQPTVPVAYPIHDGDMTSLVRGQMHYIRRGNGVEQLFNLAHDPLEQRDLAADPAFAERLGDLRREVIAAGSGGTKLTDAGK